MFTYIKLKNFLSFGNVTFDFKKTSNTAKNFVAIYGENGSGKSNFVRSIDFLCHSLSSFKRAKETEEIENLIKNNENKTPLEIFNTFLQYGNIQHHMASCRMIDCNEPTEIEYGFILNGYEGFYKLSFDKQFTNEALYYFTGKQRGYLYNITNQNTESIYKKFWSGLFINGKAKEEISDELDKFWGKHTFLGIIMNQMNEKNDAYIKESLSPFLLEIVDMFWNTTVLSKQSNRHKNSVISNKPCNVLANLRSGKISSKRESQLERSEKILREFFTQTYADIKDVSYEKEYLDNGIIKYQLFVDKMIAGKIRHISFENESAGTQQVLDIVKMLLGLFCGVTVVYDEIDDGIHDVLLNNIITSLTHEITGQLIITTHNTLLLESIDTKSAYIITVDYLGNKAIKCFDEFPIQNTNNARIKYLKGLFGGTPYIDGIDYDSIIQELSASEEAK
ncbi:MAG: AAA family ATPase [Clostridia bacterium]|nr:AAA family ATPase [Clostridia bacterium]